MVLGLSDGSHDTIFHEGNLFTLKTGVLCRGREQTVASQPQGSVNLIQCLEGFKNMFHHVKVNNNIKYTVTEGLGLKIFIFDFAYEITWWDRRIESGPDIVFGIHRQPSGKAPGHRSGFMNG